MLSKINIDQQYAVIEIKTTPSQMHITNNRPEMQVVQEASEMSIERQAPTFKVNRKKIMEESGLKGPVALSKAGRDEAREKAMRYIGSAAREGDFLGKVEQPGNRVAQLAKSKSLQTSQKEVNIGTMPKSMPEIEWEPGFVHVKWSRHQFKIEWEGEFLPDMVIDPRYSIEIFLREKPYVKITVEDDVPFYEAGQAVDEKL